MFLLKLNYYTIILREWMNKWSQGRNICKTYIHKRFVSTICKEFMQINSKKIFLNRQRKFEKTLHKRRSINGKKKAPEKMFYINRHQKNENKITMTYHHIPTGLVKWRLTISNVCEHVDQIDFTYIAGRSVKFTTLEKWQFLTVKLITYYMTPKFYYYVFTQEEQKRVARRKLV